MKDQEKEESIATGRGNNEPVFWFKEKTVFSLEIQLIYKKILLPFRP